MDNQQHSCRTAGTWFLIGGRSGPTNMSSPSTERRRPRVSRREAAQILQCSRDNVRRLERIKQLKTAQADRNGAMTYDRREVEELARQRGLSLKPTGALTARVFALFKARRSFEDVCIETEQDADTILALWERYQRGYDFGKPAAESEEARREREHAKQMQELDEELERRRRVAR
jgi:DNA-binding transcriptional MerR regulator